MNRRVIASLIFCALGVAMTTTAHAAAVASNQGTGQDGFVYSFSKVPGPVSGLFEVIPAGATTTGHDTQALTQFDLSLVGLSSAQVTSATLELFITDDPDSGFGINPTPVQPIQVDVYPITASWNRNTVTWANKPGIGSLIASQSIDTVGDWVSFDVTSTVIDWLDTPGTNFGFLLKATSPVGSSPDWVYANFTSGFGDLGPAPVLNVVPEPGSLVLALFAAPVLAWNVRRQIRRRKVSH